MTIYIHIYTLTHIYIYTVQHLFNEFDGFFFKLSSLN